MSRTIELRECCQQDTLTVDAGRPVLRGVKLLGSISKNGRRYSPGAISAGARLYESKPVNVDHDERNPTASRRVADRFGIIKNVRQDGAGVLRGDLHYNPAHPLAESVKWWAANEPAAIGLSHNATGSGRTENGTFIVEKLESVRSVDLVADPATTSSLFESRGTTMTARRRLREDDLDQPELPPLNPGGAGGNLADQVAELVASIVRDANDKAAKLAKIKKALDLLDDPKDAPKDSPPPLPDLGDDDEVEESIRDFASAVKGGPRRTSPVVRRNPLARRASTARGFIEALNGDPIIA